MNTEFFTKPAKKTGHKIVINLGSSRHNLHVSVPAMLSIVCEFGAIWFPQYVHQFHLTAKSLQGYAMIAAANSMPQGLDSHLTNRYGHDHHHHAVTKHH